MLVRLTCVKGNVELLKIYLSNETPALLFLVNCIPSSIESTIFPI